MKLSCWFFFFFFYIQIHHLKGRPGASGSACRLWTKRSQVRAVASTHCTMCGKDLPLIKTTFALTWSGGAKITTQLHVPVICCQWIMCACWFLWTPVNMVLNFNCWNTWTVLLKEPYFCTLKTGQYLNILPCSSILCKIKVKHIYQYFTKKYTCIGDHQ